MSLENVELGLVTRVKSLRQIAREVKETIGVQIGYVTCRNILLEYRKDSYMKNRNVIS